MSIDIRWMIRRDLAEVLAIESASFEGAAWSADDFVKVLHQRNCIGMIAEDRRVVGYMIYKVHSHHLDVFNLAVDPAERRKGVGTAMIRKLVGKLSSARRDSITTIVNEYSDDALRWLSRRGFRAVQLWRECFVEGDQREGDMIEMAYRLEDIESRAVLDSIMCGQGLAVRIAD